MLAEISAGLTSLNAAKQIVQGLDAMRTEAAINEVKIDLQGLILGAQQGLFAAQQQEAATAERIRALEAEVAQAKAWEAEKERYELKEFPTGVFAYEMKAEAASGEPPHRICPHCYQDGHKSILQVVAKIRGGEVVDCPKCKTRLELKESGPVQIRNDLGSGYY